MSDKIKLIRKNFIHSSTWGMMVMCDTVLWATQHKIWNSCGSEYEDCCLLRCDTVGHKRINILEEPLSVWSQRWKQQVPDAFQPDYIA
jgi:hypothetical protein